MRANGPVWTLLALTTIGSGIASNGAGGERCGNEWNRAQRSVGRKSEQIARNKRAGKVRKMVFSSVHLALGVSLGQILRKKTLVVRI